MLYLSSFNDLKIVSFLKKIFNERHFTEWNGLLGAQIVINKCCFYKTEPKTFVASKTQKLSYNIHQWKGQLRTKNVSKSALSKPIVEFISFDCTAL
jgi:hypothetical protein